MVESERGGGKKGGAGDEKSRDEEVAQGLPVRMVVFFGAPGSEARHGEHYCRGGCKGELEGSGVDAERIEQEDAESGNGEVVQA